MSTETVVKDAEVLPASIGKLSDHVQDAELPPGPTPEEVERLKKLLDSTDAPSRPSVGTIARIQELGSLIPADLQVPAETLQMLRTHITRVGIEHLEDYKTVEQCVDGINALTESGNMSACGIGDLANRLVEIGGFVDGKPKYTWKQIAEMCGGKLAESTMALYAKATRNIPLAMRPPLPFGIGHLRVVSDTVIHPPIGERNGVNNYVIATPILARCKQYIAGEVYAIHYYRVNSAGAKVTAKITDEPKTTEQVPYSLPTNTLLAKYAKALQDGYKKVNVAKSLKDVSGIMPIAFTMIDRRMVQAISKGCAESCLPVDPSLQDLNKNQIKVLKNLVNEVCGITIGPEVGDSPRNTDGTPQLTEDQKQEQAVKAAEVESARLAAIEESDRIARHMEGDCMLIDNINSKSIQALVPGLPAVVFLNSIVAAVMLLVNSKKDNDGKYNRQQGVDCLNRIRKAENDARTKAAELDAAAAMAEGMK